MPEACIDPLRYLVERLCCRVYLDCRGDVRLAFSRRHGLEEMMTAQGIARSNAGILRDQLRRAGEVRPKQEDVTVSELFDGTCCPL